MTPQELLDIACPQIGDLGWAFYFVPETLAKGQELGIDGFRFYFVGRGGPLGDVDAPVVTSAFVYFNPTLVERMWTSAKAIVAPRVAGHAFVAAAADFGRAHLAELDGLDAFCAAMDAVNDAADPIGLSLYAAARTEPLADDLPARAMQLTALLRELRGSAHLGALRAAGLDAKTAHHIHRPNDAAMFGWAAADAPDITDADRARLVAADALTDDLVRPAYAVLDDEGRSALVAGLAAMQTTLHPST